MRISDWSSDVCSSDLRSAPSPLNRGNAHELKHDGQRGMAAQAATVKQNRYVQEVRRVSASRYFSAVFFSTSAGALGAGGVLSHDWVSSQSRTNCLSNDGGLMPSRYSAAGQKRDESD